MATTQSNEQQLDLCLDLLEEKREKAQVWIVAYYQKLKKYYN